MRKIKFWFIAIYQHFCDPIISTYDNLQIAVRVYARRKAEAEVHKYMRNHHAAQAAAIDPFKDWNGFAREKNAEQSAQDDLKYELIKVDAAFAKVKARREQFEKAVARQGRLDPSPLMGASNVQAPAPTQSRPT